MRSPNRWRRIVTGSMAALCLCAAAGAADVAGVSNKSLDGLRELGDYDAALKYLDRARTDPSVPQDFKTILDYEAGMTLKDSSRTDRVTSVRQRKLAQAQALFERFLAEHPDHPLAAGVNTQMADLLVERGKVKSSQALKPGLAEMEKKRLIEEARQLFREAQNVFIELEKTFSDAHSEFPKILAKREHELIERRDHLRRDLLQARLALATVVYEIARTYEPESDPRKQALEEAAEKYAAFYEKYDTRMAGLYARMWQGRCYKELGDAKQGHEQPK